MGDKAGIMQPERLSAALQIEDRSRSSIEALRPALLGMRLSLKAQLHANGWKDVPLNDVTGKMYFVEDRVHMIALHKPNGINAMLVGGSADGAVIKLHHERPPLTMGIDSSTDQDGEGCACYDDDECLPDDLGETLWQCWQLAGVTRSDGQWYAAYRPASARVTKDEQRQHNLGISHETCGLCKLLRWAEKTSRLKLPPSIRPADATLHRERAPHATTICTACRADLEMRTPC